MRIPLSKIAHARPEYFGMNACPRPFVMPCSEPQLRMGVRRHNHRAMDRSTRPPRDLIETRVEVIE